MLLSYGVNSIFYYRLAEHSRSWINRSKQAISNAGIHKRTYMHRSTNRSEILVTVFLLLSKCYTLYFIEPPMLYLATSVQISFLTLALHFLLYFCLKLFVYVCFLLICNCYHIVLYAELNTYIKFYFTVKHCYNYCALIFVNGLLHVYAMSVSNTVSNLLCFFIFCDLY